MMRVANHNVMLYTLCMDFAHLTPKKATLDRHRPLPETLVRNLDAWFRVELTYSSNAIEGNTLSRRETALVLEKGLTVGGKSLVEHLEAVNHARAIDWIHQTATRRSQDLSEQDLLELHALVLKGIDDTNAGRYRNVAVRIAGSPVLLPNPRKVPELMEAFSDWLRAPGDLHPVEFAAEAHYRLVSIHPFVDGNGRTARLLMNLILLMTGYPPAFIPVRERLAYISALEKAQLGGSKEAYLNLIGHAVECSLNIYLKALSGGPEAPSDEPGLLRIGTLSRRTGLTLATIRYWTREGLLDIAERTASGYQLYSPAMIERVRQIQALKEQRFTLPEIRERLDRG